MKRALRMLNEFRNIVYGKPRFEITKIADLCLEGPPLGGDAPARQAATPGLVDDLAERPAGAARFRLEVGRHIVIQGERSSHVLMLQSTHRDVKTRPV